MHRKTISDWLIHCADPLGPRTARPRQNLAGSEMHEFVERAEYHGILGALLKNFPAFGEASKHDADDYADAKRDARERHRVQRAFALMLQTQADAVMAEAHGIPATIVKGPTFARCIYPQPWYRPFTDIDFLVAPESLARLEAILAGRGYRLHDEQDATGQCRSWVHDEFRPTLFELHLDLNANERWPSSFRYDDIADGPQRPAALLMTAIIHGGATHRFLRLQHVIDVCQGARHVTGAQEEAAFAALAKKTNTRTLAEASLLLVGRMMAEPRCLELAAMLGESSLARLAGRSLGPAATTGAKDEFGTIARLQRKIWREAIGFGDRL